MEEFLMWRLVLAIGVALYVKALMLAERLPHWTVTTQMPYNTIIDASLAWCRDVRTVWVILGLDEYDMYYDNITVYDFI